MKRGLLPLLFLAYSSIMLAQSPTGDGKITGKVVDSTTGAPVQFATLSLMTQDSGITVNGTTADDKGNFKITGIAPGTYKLTIVFFGYKNFEQTSITISKSNPNIALGNIKLASASITMKSATVVADKAIIENKIDRTVYNVENDLTSQTGVANDVLKKIPQVSVDVDGNVELQGSSSVLFLINGKPSIVYGSNITEVLQSIPASQIQSIEVITSPGAKYDASGTGGIINIILKKSTAEGINCNLSLTGGTRLENGSFNFNAHHKKLSASAFISSNAQLQSTTLTSLNTVSKDSTNKQTTLTENGSSGFSRFGLQTGASLDFDITEKDNINGSFGYSYYSNTYSGSTNRNTLIDSSENVISNVNDVLPSANNFYSKTYDWSLDYKHKFNKDGHELELSYVSSVDNNYFHYQQSQQFITPDSVYAGSYGNNPGTEQETDFAIDYTLPVNDNTEIETGLKSETTQITSNSGVYVLNPLSSVYDYNSSQSQSLNYTSQVYAGYFSIKFKFLKWLDVKTGFRYEYTQPKAYYSDIGNVYIAPYGTYVPSAVIAHTFANHQTVKLSYSHRIERPDYRDLDPFVNATDPRNLTTGNPNLQPEIGDKIELGYNRILGKGANLNLTLFYRGNTNDIQPYTMYYPSYVVGDTTYTNVLVTTRANVGREDNYGMNIYVSIPFTGKMDFRTNMAFFQRYIINGTLPGNNIQGFNYRLNGNFSYQVTKTLVIELFGNYNSPRLNVGGTMPGFFTYNFALRKQFDNKKASIALTATNPFNYYVNQATNLTGINFTEYSLRELPYQSFGINFTYKFGHLEFKDDKPAEDPNLNQQGGN